MPCANKGCSSLIPARAPVPVWVDWPRSRWPSAILRGCRQMRERWRQRRALRQLDDPAQADVAVSRKQAVGEKRKQRLLPAPQRAK
jgi:uncharacterized protein YjiS (DUF1127 family)